MTRADLIALLRRLLEQSGASAYCLPIKRKDVEALLRLLEVGESET